MIVGLAGAGGGGGSVIQQQRRFFGRPDNLAVVESRTDISDLRRELLNDQATKPSRGNERCLTQTLAYVRMVIYPHDPK